MRLQYHQATYDLLTQKRINPQKAIENHECLEANHFCGDISEEEKERLRQRFAKVREQKLAWTTLDLYQRPVKFSKENIQQLDSLEQKFNVRIPAAVREWYSLDIVPEIMSAMGWGLFPISEFKPIIQITEESNLQPQSDLWYFLSGEYINQGGEIILFQIDAGDNPPVLAEYDNRYVELAPTFSEFINFCFGDWYLNYTFDYWFSIIHRLPEKYHVSLDHLREIFLEFRNNIRLHLYDEHACILVLPAHQHDDLVPRWDFLAGGRFRADSIETLENLIHTIWRDNIPAFQMYTWGHEVSEKFIDQIQRDLLQRVLKQIDVWVTAPDLAFKLGASIPVLSTPMVKHLNWLIGEGEAEAHPDNSENTKLENRYRGK